MAYVRHLRLVASIEIHHFIAPCHLWVVSVKHVCASEVRPAPLQTTYLLFLVEVEGLEAKHHIKRTVG